MKILLNMVLVIFLTIFFSAPGLAAELTIYTENSPPANFTKDGRMTGSSVEIVEKIQERLNNTDQIKMVPWKRGYVMLETKPNTALFSTTRTAERESKFKWVGPILRLKWAFYAKKNSDIQLNSLEDAKKVKSIGTYLEDARDQFLVKNGFKNLERVYNNNLNVKKLLGGRIDLFVSTNLGVGKIVQEAGGSVKDIKEVFVIKQADLYIAFSKQTDDAVIADWQSALDAMKKDGSFEKIYTRWFPGEVVPY